ncbi:N-formylglutamate amidohydrolase [Sinorhizobium sp. 8-89]|uniref:N-formylglutamate amidohydrolase n=1 Tax=Sinorhizobium sp. 7-81 TaxID=3049087 RepID=UPI0024C28E09|nr:N-formylglutamate amidohydrolase [Sinorhizobium sp. 7-81]MDK1387881.1 N-formylglutamate amidohydrolase [Sinorhizobium sp. 7-81]
MPDYPSGVSTEPLYHEWWTQHRGDSPVVATAIHNGHVVRGAAKGLLALSDVERLREEDPFTEFIIRDFPNRIIVHRSRFEVDINRPRSGAIYMRPEQAWGLKVWNHEPPREVVETSLAMHDEYYAMLEALLAGIERRYGRFVVLDVHSYNHRRDGPEAEAAKTEVAPEVNIGTSSMDRVKWARVVDAFVEALRSTECQGRRLDVRENIAFQGRGEQTRFIHERYPDTGCAIAVEFKKFFMDEWTGEPDLEALGAIRKLVSSTLPLLVSTLGADR